MNETLTIDIAMRNRTRPSYAKVKIEMDKSDLSQNNSMMTKEGYLLLEQIDKIKETCQAKETRRKRNHYYSSIIKTIKENNCQI